MNYVLFNVIQFGSLFKLDFKPTIRMYAYALFIEKISGFVYICRHTDGREMILLLTLK